MSNTWHTHIKPVLYVFIKFKLKIFTPLIEGKMLGEGWFGASNYD